jgi:hypothetical protein
MLISIALEIVVSILVGSDTERGTVSNIRLDSV